MSFEIELEETPERTGVARGDGKAEGPDMRVGAFEGQVEADFGGSHGLAVEALAEEVEVAGEEEGERLEVVEGMFEIGVEGVIGTRGFEVQGAGPFAAGEFLEEGGIRAEAFGQAVFRQPTELLERPDTPLREHRLGVGAERQDGEGEHAEPAGFLAGLHESYAAEATSGEDREVGVASDGDVAGEAAFVSAAGDLRGDGGGGADEAAESVNGEDDGLGVEVFGEGREVACDEEEVRGEGGREFWGVKAGEHREKTSSVASFAYCSPLVKGGGIGASSRRRGWPGFAGFCQVILGFCRDFGWFFSGYLAGSREMRSFRINRWRVKGGQLFYGTGTGRAGGFALRLASDNLRNQSGPLASG